MMRKSAQKLVTATRELDRDEAALSRRQVDRRWAEIDQLLADVLADHRAVTQLVKVLRTTNDLAVRWMLRDRVLPARQLALTDPDAFRAHPLVGFTAKQLPIKPCLALVDLHRPPETPRRLRGLDYRPDLSWFAGLPADEGTGKWPRNEAGDPLTHLAQVDLGFFTSNRGAVSPNPAALGLPETGVLQLFHDLENYGNLDDSAAGSWRLRWVASPTRLRKPPRDLAGDSWLRPASAMAVAMVASVPSLLDYNGRKRNRYNRVAEHLSTIRRDEPDLFGLEVGEGWTYASAWEDDFVSLDGDESSLGGFGYPDLIEEVPEILAAKLPLAAADEHVLVFDIAGTGTLEDWFGDCGHLQVWMRASDRDHRRFDRSWCIIRTD